MFPPVLGWRSACSTVQLFLFVSFALAQSTFPDPATLLKEIQANQHKMDDIRENYTFHRIVTEDDLDEKGAVIKTTTREREIFFVNGHRIGRLVKKDGMELKGTEEKNEQSRVKKLIEISMKAPPPKEEGRPVQYDRRNSSHDEGLQSAPFGLSWQEHPGLRFHRGSACERERHQRKRREKNGGHDLVRRSRPPGRENGSAFLRQFPHRRRIPRQRPKRHHVRNRTLAHRRRIMDGDLQQSTCRARESSSKTFARTFMPRISTSKNSTSRPWNRPLNSFIPSLRARPFETATIFGEAHARPSECVAVPPAGESRRRRRHHLHLLARDSSQRDHRRIRLFAGHSRALPPPGD